MFIKGISPLIAAVILIAFVIAVAGIASTFFTGFTKEQAAGVTAKAGTTIDCAVAVLELDPDFVGFENSTTPGTMPFDEVTLVLSNKGQTSLDNLKITTYSASDVKSCSATAATDGIEVAQVKTVTSDVSLGTCVSDGYLQTLTKIRVTTEDCPGVGSTISNQTVAGRATWVLTE